MRTHAKKLHNKHVHTRYTKKICTHTTHPHNKHMYTSNTATQYKYAHTLHSYTTNICTHATQLHNKNMHTCYTANRYTSYIQKVHNKHRYTVYIVRTLRRWLILEWMQPWWDLDVNQTRSTYDNDSCRLTVLWRAAWALQNWTGSRRRLYPPLCRFLPPSCFLLMWQVVGMCHWGRGGREGIKNGVCVKVGQRFTQ